MDGPEDLAHLVGVVEEIKYPLNKRWFFPSKVGGRPAWLVPDNIPEMKCDCCEKTMTFLLQIYAPDNENANTFHRSIMVFVCLSCRCLLRVVRAQLPHENPYYGREAISTKDELSDDTVLESVLCEECGMRYHGRSLCRALPEYQIDIEELDEIVIGEDEDMNDDSDDEDMEDLIPQDVDGDIKYTETSIDNSESDLFKDFADTAVENDACFRVFKKFVDEAPMNQVVYYSVGGTPIWITEKDQLKGAPSCCQNCGSDRQFEFQIQPQLIFHLMKRLKGYPMNAAPFEWGVVAIYTCKNNCVPKSNQPYIEELAYNQMEPSEWLDFNSRKKVDFTKDSRAAPKIGTGNKHSSDEDDEGEWM